MMFHTLKHMFATVMRVGGSITNFTKEDIVVGAGPGFNLSTVF
jgi:hypothetical protein